MRQTDWPERRGGGGGGAMGGGLPGAGPEAEPGSRPGAAARGGGGTEDGAGRGGSGAGARAGGGAEEGGPPLPRELLLDVLRRLPMRDLLKAGAACREWGQVAEEIFRDACMQRSWRAPRRPRTASVPQGPLVWRGLFVSKVCRLCCGPGEFGVRRRERRSQRLVLAYTLCEKCVLSERALGFYKRHGLIIDLIGASGLELHQIKKKYIAHQDSALSAG